MTKNSYLLLLLTALSLPALATAQAQTAEPASAVKAAEPVLVQPAPPAPVTPPAPPAPPKRCDFSVTLSGDESFDANKDKLKDAAKQNIDTQVLPKLADCSKVDMIVVAGHTDITGKPQTLQKLSEKRADAVAAYLASKGVSATMDTLGMGKTQQIKACDEKLPKIKLAECLAPNRRIVIEVRGLAK